MSCDHHSDIEEKKGGMVTLTTPQVYGAPHLIYKFTTSVRDGAPHNQMKPTFTNMPAQH